MKKYYLLGIYGAWIMMAAGCAVQKSQVVAENKGLQQLPELASAHVGICIMDLATGAYIYQYQPDKYFMPASNTKLLTCYAAMKYLGDSLEGLDVTEWPDHVDIRPTGDPTLLHPDFTIHPIYSYLKNIDKPLHLLPALWTGKAYGTGWAWDDYADAYMAERSALPVYGNVVTVSGSKPVTVVPGYFSAAVTGVNAGGSGYVNAFNRLFHQNTFSYTNSGKALKRYAVPFITSDSIAVQLLGDTLHKNLIWQPIVAVKDNEAGGKQYVIHSQLTDSVLRFMMHRSDNFYAEQSLLMVSRLQLHEMNTDAIIARLLATDFKSMPQRPRWVDGSGLSRYNLISPQDMVWLLAKMKTDFSWKRITGILQTGNEGTLEGLYTNYAGKIYAKTGTLSNNLSLSGYLLTAKGKTLAFSVLINNHQASASAVRKQIEQWLIGILNAY
ncbi:D-alanyl-D-alanine carboxypeptidase / D-alanyl-D-alanine-endopeptidase (penicillin-binding protein 4) [Filimonas lacunae]|uniref:D-alanyl-D-alanine carboxypeptidase / D-alanyl-D-alanine-endopeptidase (Penicillin-binding protein 4) n=1 Tax=Filimonas lacunae TaxID=477680 RepID=A0A173MQY7_9BACT|nr:D-alanyl-D-alanine carboxypeptidase [Filimonas lacunae]BAV10072.1 D-alanyl-D-alanine carboxypeptidase [Filimonas lacunae]SIS83565.1 D-alanyl-D-alanine carboxypeptidase / D-alanyl-D-alanine-endopeptidase (penicillin-binding protein 4) [Filimonas lacunae]